MQVIVLIYFILLACKYRKKTLVFFITILLSFSLVSRYLISSQVNDYSMNGMLHSILVIIFLGSIVTPWKLYCNVKSFQVVNEKRLNVISKILSWVCIVLTIYCFYISCFVYAQIDDINKFKYVDGTSDFLYSLGITMKPYILVVIAYPISYILIPLHFYYLSKKEVLRSSLCFLGSLLTIAYGMTYFSRFHIIHYFLLYIAFYLLLKNTLYNKIRRKIKYISLLFLMVGVIIFITISFSRFESFNYVRIESDSRIQNSTIYSLVDYFSMWWPHSQTLFNNYDFQSFNGQLSLQSISYFFSVISFGLIPDFCSGLSIERVRIWKDLSGSFNGFSIYSLYDFGIFFSILYVCIYYYKVKANAPRNGNISITWLMICSLLLQLPLYSIFYSVLHVVLLGLLLYLPINLYINKK